MVNQTSCNHLFNHFGDERKVGNRPVVSKNLCIEAVFFSSRCTVADLRFDGWMDERCFRPLLCTVKAELGRGQPGLMR